MAAEELVHLQLPPVTRAYITLSFLTTAGCALDVSLQKYSITQAAQPFSHIRHLRMLQVISPFNIYFNARLIFQKGEVWRLLTTFMFFGSLGWSSSEHMIHTIHHGQSALHLFACSFNAIVSVAGLDFVFHMFFLIKYSKSLEEGSFRGRSADFLWMLLIGQPAFHLHLPAPMYMKPPSYLPILRLFTCRAGGAVLTCCAPFVNIQFLGSSLTFMMVSCCSYTSYF